MKNMKRFLSMAFALVFMFTVMMSAAVFADNGSDKAGGKTEKATEEKVKGNDKVKTEEAVTEDTEEERDNAAKKELLEIKKEAKKALIGLRKDSKATPEAIAEAYSIYMGFKDQLKAMVREQYTEEELAQLDAEAAAIEAADPTADALPLDKVIAKGRSLKFDMPPIYKEGKVMVPVRAFSAAYGADVQWNGETKEITITTLEGKVVVINMNINPETNAPTVTVDGTPIEIVAKNVNGRVVLPVGFIAEQLGLKVEVDEEDGTVEVDEDTDADDEVVDPLLNTPTVQ